MYWTLELATKLEDAPWPATKDELLDYAQRVGAPMEVIENLQEIEDDVRNAAYVIIKAKKATYYGIGMALARIVKAIFADESSILTVSACMKGEYGLNGVYIGVPSVVGRDGIKRVLPLSLTTDELAKLTESGRILEENYRSIEAVKPIMA